MSKKSLFFPPAEDAEPEGLLALGGRLDPTWLLDAYTHGIFPWPFCDAEEKNLPLGWWSPDPRGIIELDCVHVPRRLERTIRSGTFETTLNRDFRGVMLGCAMASGREGETWITPEMIEAYSELHRLGFAHSVEARRDGRLVGGVYGVGINGLFAAESMFYSEPDASKVALVRLFRHLADRGYRLLDIQMITPHTERFGAIEIPRKEYLRRLAAALSVRCSFVGK